MIVATLEDLKKSRAIAREKGWDLSSPIKDVMGVYARHSIINDKNYTPTAKICSAKPIVA